MNSKWKYESVRVGSFNVTYVGFLKVWQVRGPENEFVVQFANKRSARSNAFQFAYAADKGYQLAKKQWAETHMKEVA